MIQDSYKFEGPYGRYYRALFDIEHPDQPQSDDPWVLKLIDILKLEEHYANKKDGMSCFLNEYPLYYELITTFRATQEGSDKDMLEACILASRDYKEIEEALNIPRFNRLFIGLYQELFYHVNHFRSNPAMFARYVVIPMTKMNSGKLAIGQIWKLLGSAGGLNALVTKGFGSSAIHPEDIGYILQMCSYRHCSLLMQYITMGPDMFIDNPGASVVLDKLTDFDSIRGNERRSDGFARITGISRNAFSDMLSCGVKLISLPKDLDNKVFAADGEFHPELIDAIEKVKNINIEETNND